VKVLETPRLVLRWVELADAAFFVRLLNDPAWLQYIGDRSVHTEAAAAAHIEKSYRGAYARNGFGLYLVESRSTGEPLGICGLLKRDQLEDLDLGFAFVATARGQGYAREACAAVLAHEPAAQGRGRVVAITLPTNAASIGLLEKLGFRYERTLDWGGGKPPVSLYAWQAPKTAAPSG